MNYIICTEKDRQILTSKIQLKTSSNRSSYFSLSLSGWGFKNIPKHPIVRLAYPYHITLQSWNLNANRHLHIIILKFTIIYLINWAIIQPLPDLRCSSAATIHLLCYIRTVAPGNRQAQLPLSDHFHLESSQHSRIPSLYRWTPGCCWKHYEKLPSYFLHK